MVHNTRCFKPQHTWGHQNTRCSNIRGHQNTTRCSKPQHTRGQAAASGTVMLSYTGSPFADLASGY
eukprot:8076581-Pyramimonas_sp.AAC.1